MGYVGARSKYVGHGQVITTHRILWDEIAFPYPWYLLLAQKYSIVISSLNISQHESVGQLRHTRSLMHNTALPIIYRYSLKGFSSIWLNRMRGKFFYICDGMIWYTAMNMNIVLTCLKKWPFIHVYASGRLQWDIVRLLQHRWNFLKYKGILHMSYKRNKK